MSHFFANQTDLNWLFYYGLNGFLLCHETCWTFVMFVGSTWWLSVLFSVGLLEEEANRIDNKDNFMINTLENENKELDSDSQVFCMEGSL